MAGFVPAALAVLALLAPQQAGKKPANPPAKEPAAPPAALEKAPAPVAIPKAPPAGIQEVAPQLDLPPAGPPRPAESAAGKAAGIAGSMGGLGWLGVGAGLTAVFGLLTSVWGQLKAFGHRLFSMAITTVEIPNESAHDAMVAYLIKNYQRSRIYDRMYGAYYEHHRDGKYGLVPFEQYGQRMMIFWNGRFPFFFTNAVEAKAAASKGAAQSGGTEATKIHSTVTFLRGTLDIEAVLQKACSAVNSLTWTVENNQEKAKNRFVIHHFPKRDDDSGGDDSSSNGLAWYQQGYYRLLAHQADQLGKAPLRDGKALDGLIFPQRVKDLIGEIELWRNSRDWYRAKGIPWKRGWLLYGPPGTGKTALARAFAEDLNMPVYVFNLAEMGNHALLKAWTEMQVNVPCVALIEDIDNVFHGRKNVARRAGYMGLAMPAKKDDSHGSAGADFGSMAQPLTFDCLLNCLDGVERTDGVFTIVTTNDLSKIDPALGLPRQLPDGTTEFISTRPGRIDKAVELTFMEPADKKLMAKRILGEYPDDYLTMLEFVDKYLDLQETPAQFQERCAQMALRRFWKEKHAADPLAVPAPPPAASPNGAAKREPLPAASTR